MATANCGICTKPFYVKPSHILRGWGKYCSKACQNQSQKRGHYIHCFICNKEAWRLRKDLKHSKSGNYFCSKTCQTIWRNSVLFVGPKHSNWKGGEFAYRDAMIRSKAPRYCNRCDLQDTRILAVHHLDKNRQNNALQNLVWLCHNCHYLIHHDKLEMEQFMKSRTRK